MLRRSQALLLVPVIAIIMAGCSAPVVSNADADGRTVDTVFGAVTVPAKVNSVIVLEGRRDLDIVLSLGLPLTGMPHEAGVLDLDSPVAEALAESEAKELFLADEINIEAIAAAAPDLIVSRADDAEPILAELQTIAPVIAIGDQGSSRWQDDLMLVANATGTTARADALINDYDADVAALADEYRDVLAAHRFAPISYNGDSVETRPNRLLSTVLRDLDANPSAAFAAAIAGEDGDGAYSLERLVEGFGDADAIIALVNDPQTWQQLQADPLFQQLPAVQQGHVVRSDKQTHEGAALTAQHSLAVVKELLQTL